jgi:hypothetical protein
MMRKQTIRYDSLVDALVAVSKRLSRYEAHYSLESEEFFNRYSRGQVADEADFVEWANDYQHYLAIRGMQLSVVFPDTESSG